MLTQLISDIVLLFWLIPSERYEIMMLLLDVRDTLYTYLMLTCLSRFVNPCGNFSDTSSLKFSSVRHL